MKQWLQVLVLLSALVQLEVRAQVELHGGVDVGNGRIVAGMYEGFFPKERQLKAKVQQTLRELSQGQHQRVLEWIEQGQCKNFMAYDSTEVVKSLRPMDSGWQRGVLGYTRVELKGCKTPFSIEADEPPLFEEDGFSGF